MRIFARAIALSVLLVAVPGAVADEFRDIANRFTITAPQGWKRVSDADVKKLDDFAAQNMPSRNFNYIAAFTKSKTKNPFDVPYVVIQVTHVRLKGQNYDGFEKGLGTGKMREATQEAASQLSFIKDFNPGEWVLDKAHNRMLMNMSMTGPTGVQLKTLCTAYFGDESIIQVNCYADAAKIDASMPEFEAMNAGFQFDPGAEFHPVPKSIWSGPAGTGLIGGIVGGLVGLLSVVFKKIKGG